MKIVALVGSSKGIMATIIKSKSRRYDYGR